MAKSSPKRKSTKKSTSGDIKILVAAAALFAATGLAFMADGSNLELFNSTATSVDRPTHSAPPSKVLGKKTNAEPTVTCTDTDDGFNTRVKGSIKVVHNKQKRILEVGTDVCADNTSVREFSCNNGQSNSAIIKCHPSLSCQNGACVAP